MVEVEEEERPQTQFVGGGISKRAHTPETGLFHISILYWIVLCWTVLSLKFFFEVYHSPDKKCIRLNHFKFAKHATK